MADTYFETGSGFGVVDDAANVPPGATIITLAAYNALVADAVADAAAVVAAELAASQAKFLQVFKAYRSLGMAPGDSRAAASVVGAEPPGFNPVTEPFVPLHVIYETPSIGFSHALAAAANVYEKVDDLPDLVIVEPGTYLVSWTAGATAVIPGSTAAVSTGTTVGIFRDAALVAGTETKLALVSQGLAAAAQPAMQMQASGGGTMRMTIAAGQALSMHGKRSTIVGTNTFLSDADGRCRITAERISL